MKYNCDILCQAIILSAVEDYRNAVNDNRKQKARALERWFLSDWGQALSNCNGELIVERLRNEPESQRRTRRNVPTKY